MPPCQPKTCWVAKEELNETPETRNACLRQLKEMLSKQKEFTSRTDDDFLLRFLRCRKFDCKKALKMLREHYKFRKLHPGVYLSPTALEEALRLCIFNYLPHRDHKGRVICLLRFDRWDVDKISYEDFIAAGNLMCEYALDNNPVTQINGFIAIWDYKGFNVRHFKLFCSLRNTLTLVNLLQIKILSGIEQLHEHLDQSILPKEYGGTLEIPDTKEIAQRIKDKEKDILLNNKFGF
ncbi:clavesin-1 [Caerostris darwini]|uniref:Clavesin-1 n=1 Tax=Caerostris darwini TaxID=1538125 RepID=A0AAV4NNZ2_9ARAC|nr:clavesin-1 [Caerostris darwini]